MTLLAPLFLAGLLGIGLPVWLHRLSSENPNRKPFSSLMFLEAGEPQRVLAKNVQYLLLLACRIAVLVLLALAFAQPALWRQPASAAGDGAALHVIVLDSSASMSHADRWERARSAALDIAGELAADDRGQVVAAGRTLELLTAVTEDPSVVRQAINIAEPSEFFLDYGQLVSSLDGVVRSAELPVVLHIVTDAQQSALPTRFAELAPREAAEIRIHDVAPEREANWAVDRLVASAASGDLEASVRSFAAEAATRSVRLEINGELVASEQVDVPAGESVQVGFRTPELDAGSNRISVSITPNDDLALDDARFVALQRPEPNPVLLVSADVRGRDLLFVEAAMESLAGLALAPDRVTSAELADRDLADYPFIVVADAAALGNDVVGRLRGYVESGGNVLLALGSRSTGLVNVPLTGQSFATGSATGLGASAEYASVGAMDASHPALRGVDGLRAARIFRHAAVVPGAGDESLISLDDGAPLLLERELGNGRVLVFTSSLDKEWNDLPLMPVFVPLIAGLSDYLLGGAGFTAEAELGTTLALRAMGLSGGQIFDPEGEPVLGLGGTDDVLLDRIGFYELVGGGQRELVAVNFDVRESDLTPLPAESIARWQELGRPADQAVAPSAARQESAAILSPLAQWLLILLLAAVIMESWIGNWHLRVRRGIAA